MIPGVPQSPSAVWLHGDQPGPGGAGLPAQRGPDLHGGLGQGGPQREPRVPRAGGPRGLHQLALQRAAGGQRPPPEAGAVRPVPGQPRHPQPAGNNNSNSRLYNT